MSDEKRQAERVPIGLRVRLRFADLESFVAGYASNISRNGVYLEGVAPRPTDTLVRFELLLADGTVALRGEGRVIWSRSDGPETGLALRFTRLESRSKALIDDLVARARVGAGSIPPPPPAKPAAPAPAPMSAPSAPSRAAASGVVARAPEPAARPERVRINSARVSRPSLAELDDELAALERDTLDRISAQPSAPAGRRASLIELERELAELESAAPRASREPAPPPAVPRAPEQQPARRLPSVAPPIAPGEANELPPVLALLGADGTLESPIEPAPPVAKAPAPPLVADAEPLPVAPVPLATAMREPTPVPSEPPEELDADMLEEADDTGVSAIPQPPALPSADVTASAALDDDLPALDLASPDVPAEPAPPAASEPPKRRSLLGKLLGR